MVVTLIACGVIAVGFVVARSNGPGERDVPTERADSPDRDPAVATLAPGARGGAPAAELSAPRLYRVGSNARALVGRVVARADGRSIEGAVVTSHVTGALGDETATTTTDVRGAFRVAVPGESATLRIAAPGFAPVERFGVVPEKAQLVRLSPAPRLVGRVVNEEGAPVAGVTVRTRAGGGAMARVVGETTSDADGRFALEGLPIGVVRVEARGRGWVPYAPPSVSVPRDRSRQVPLEPGRTSDVTLIVMRGVEVRGRVLDADGTPVADASVWCESEYGDPELAGSGAWSAPIASTGTDGAFVVSSLFPGVRYFVSARAADGRQARSAELPVSQSAPIPLELRLASACFVDVKVSDVGTKAPISGALVEVSVRWESGVRPDDRRWTTGSDGLVRVGPLPPLRGQVSASVAGYHQTFASDFPQATPEGVAAAVGLRRLARVAGHVVWPDGSAASGVRVRIRGTVGFVGTDRFVTTDEGGSFESGDVKPGPCRVAASALRDGQPFSVEADAVAGGPPVVLTLAPGELPAPVSRTPPEGFRNLRVRVVDPGGNPVPTATVRWGSSQATAREGVALVVGPEGRPATIEAYDARDEDGMPLPLGPGVASGIEPTIDEVTVRLTPGHVLAGRVVGPAGEPVPSVAVSMQSVLPAGVAADWPSTHASTYTDSDGRFRVESLGDGEYAIVVPRVPGLFAPNSPVRARAGATNVVVALHAAAAATITVTDARGAPVEGALVSVLGRGWRYAMNSGSRSRSRSPLGTSYGEIRTDSRGEARLVGLDPDAAGASLHVYPPTDRADLGPFALEPFAPSDRTVVLPDIGSIRGTVVRDGDEGGPVRIGRVLYRRDGVWSPADFDDRARFVVDGVPPGEYELAAVPHAQDAPSPGATIVRAKTGDASVVVPLSTGATLDVTADGVAANEIVFFRLRPETSDDRGGARAEIGWGASARFFGVLAGVRYSLMARSGDRVGVATGFVARAEPYVVRLEKGLSITGRITAPVAVYVQRVVAEGPAPEVVATTDGDRYSLVGLVPGAWTITVEARDEECRLWRGTATVAAGETADVALALGAR